jgi:hypothetical protein
MPADFTSQLSLPKQVFHGFRRVNCFGFETLAAVLPHQKQLAREEVELNCKRKLEEQTEKKKFEH